jgi:hypothetical protein
VAVIKLVQLCHIGPKLRIFDIRIPKLARLCHLDPKLMMYGICIPKLAWKCHLGPKVQHLYREKGQFSTYYFLEK